MISPKVSIITAAFNSEKTIKDTIESVLNQTYENIEYLIIDGGSTDKTIEIIKKHERLFNGRLTWISESDNGIYDAWNKGVKLSTGDWISFVGSDDILCVDALKKYIDAIENNHDINFISSNILLVKKDLNPIRKIGKPWSGKMKSHTCIAHSGSLHHNSLFRLKGLFNINYPMAGDYDFLIRCYDIIKPYYLPIITLKFREGGASNISVFSVAKEMLKIKINNKRRPVFICYLDYFLMIIKYYLRKIITRHC